MLRARQAYALLALLVFSVACNGAEAAENATNFYILGLKPPWRVLPRHRAFILPTSTIFMLAARLARLPWG